MFKDENRHYSLRKLSVGLASVLIGISFASSMNGNSVKADTVSAQTSTIETKTSENKVNTNVDVTKEVVKDQKITNQSSNHAEDNSQTQPQNTQKLNEKVLATQLTKVQDQTATIQSQEKAQTSFVQNSVADQPQKNLLDNLGKQKASTENNQAEAKNQENRLVDQINYKLTNNTSTDNKEDLGQNKVAPDETKQTSTIKSNAEKSIVSPSSTQKINNQLNDHAEDNSQSQLQNSQKLNLTKNSQQLNQKELATNLTQDNSTQNNDWADPAKQGFHKTNVGWTKHTIGDGTFDAIAKSIGSWTIDNVTSQKTITSNDSYVLPVQHLKDVVISKDDLKTKKNILIGTAIRLRDPASENGYATKFNWIWTSPNYVYASDGSLLGTLYFADSDNNDHTKNNEIDYIFQVHADKSVLDRITSDLKFSYTDQNQLVINDDSGTDRLPTGKTIHEKYILGNSNSVDVTTNNPAFKPNDYKENDWQQYKLNTAPRYSQVNFGYWTSDSSKNDPTNYTYHQVIKVQGNPENNHFDLSNLSIYTRRYINMSQDANSSHIFSTNGSNNQWSDKYYYNRTKLQDNLSALDVYNQTTKNNRLTYSVQKDGSVLIGINVDTTDPEWKLSDNDIKSALSFNKYYQSLSAKDQQTMMNETLKKYHNHSNFAFENDISVQGINWDHSKSIVETVTDVTPNKPAWQNSNPIVVSYAVGSSTNIDSAQFRTYNVQYKDELTGKIVNNDTISTQTGNNVDYLINIPKGFLLAPNQTIIVDGNSVTLNNNKFQFTVPKNEPATTTPIVINLTQDNSTQKDYTPDISAWTGHDDGTYYILDKYTPQNDTEKDLIVIPNEADFEKAGKSTNGHEVGITRNTVKNLMTSVNPKEIHFSETDNKKIKAIDALWLNAFSTVNSYVSHSNSRLKAVTGNSFDTSNIQQTGSMFGADEKLVDISALKSWNTANFNSTESMFNFCYSLNDLSALSNWNTSNILNFGHMFYECNSLTNIDPLKNWNTSKIHYWDNMFRDCPNLTNIDAINNWNYSSAGINTAFGNYPLDDMFYGDHKIKINIGTDSGLADFIRRTGRIDAFHNSSNQISTSNTKLIELLTNTDFQAQNETTTAKRTITFTGLPANRAIPPIVQTINYTKLATAVIDMTGTSDSNAHGKIVSSGFEKNWKLDTSKQNDDVIIDGVICFKPVKIPHINGYKCHLIKDPVNPNILMLSFMAIPQQSSNETQPSQSTSNNIQSSQKPAQAKQKQPEPIQTKPAKQEEKEVVQILDHIAHELMNDNADSFEPAQNDSAPLETADVTQKVKPEPAKPSPIETQVPVGTHDSLNKYTLTTNDPLPDTLVFNNIESDQATQTYDVVLSHQTEAAHRTHEVHETVDYVYADGSQASKSFTAKPLVFKQNIVKNSAQSTTQDTNQLPQTGSDEQANLLSIIGGSLMTSLALFGLDKKKKHKN